MLEKIKSAQFWASVVSQYLSENWLSLLILVVILVVLAKKAFSYSTMDPGPFKKAFLLVLAVGLLAEGYFFYDAYDMQAQLLSQPKPQRTIFSY